MSLAVDIVLPCYNPNETWHEELCAFYDFIRPFYAVNFIVVNDGSISGDPRAQVNTIREKGVPVSFISYSKNRGKGYALRQGVAASSAQFILYTDIDFPFTNDSMKEVLSTLTSGESNIVAGFRNDNYYEKNISAFRIQLSKTFRFFISDILRMPVTDTQCGLKGFDKKGKEKFLQTSINRYLFDFEFIYTAVKSDHLSISAVPVRLKENVVFSKMRFKILAQESINLLSVLVFSRTRK
jgi:glycosyltransferase involved in cell wall biosynthesis